VLAPYTAYSIVTLEVRRPGGVVTGR